MKKIIPFALGGFITAAALVVLAQLTGLINLAKKSEQSSPFRNTGTLELVCDLEIKRPVDGLAQPPEVTHKIMPAGVDFENNTGWYTGEYAISTNRKGMLSINGSVLEVSRPAMFSRYNVTIISEHFTLDRKNGEFQQWLEIKGGKKLDLISGSCMRSEQKAF